MDNINPSDLPKFPDPNKADKDGLLAIGGDLSIERLYSAYLNGVFPWFGPGDPILWFSPDPRMLLFPENLHVSKSMKRVFNQNKFTFTCDQSFESVIDACSKVPREGQDGTWITTDMIQAYIALHKAGHAHSVEVWNKEDELVGGIYGVAIGKAFFGESMFSKVSNASKAALIKLLQSLELLGFDFLDCQVYTPHLESMGARLYPRSIFLEQLNLATAKKGIDKRDWVNLFA